MMNESRKVMRRDLLRWASWFGVINAVLYALIGLRYLVAFGIPAGMVLYWTSSNLFHLIKVQALQVRERLRRDASA